LGVVEASPGFTALVNEHDYYQSILPATTEIASPGSVPRAILGEWRDAQFGLTELAQFAVIGSVQLGNRSGIDSASATNPPNRLYITGTPTSGVEQVAVEWSPNGPAFVEDQGESFVADVAGFSAVDPYVEL